MNNINLKKYDYILLVDRSGSMAMKDTPQGSRWDQAKEWGKQIAFQCELYDSNGIDLIFFDHDLVVIENTTSTKFDELFHKYRPNGSTGTTEAFEEAFKLHFKKFKKPSGFLSSFTKSAELSRKPTIIICITDGIPDNRSSLRSAIIKATKEIESKEDLGITFVQVGKDSSARSFLKELDDDLQSKGAKYDIVDCKDYSEMSNCSIKDVLIGAITD